MIHAKEASNAILEWDALERNVNNIIQSQPQQKLNHHHNVLQDNLIQKTSFVTVTFLTTTHLHHPTMTGSHHVKHTKPVHSTTHPPKPSPPHVSV